MQACNNGTTGVIGVDGRNKHERKDQESWASLTVYRTGSIDGVSGPTIFLLEGKNKRVNYTDKFLRDNCAAPSLTLLVTPTALITEEAYIAATHPIVSGLRRYNHIVAVNP